MKIAALDVTFNVRVRLPVPEDHATGKLTESEIEEFKKAILGEAQPSLADGSEIDAEVTRAEVVEVKV